MASMRFMELPSAPDVSFWARLAELKLNEYKLSEEPIPVVGHYRANVHEGLVSPLVLTSASFDLQARHENKVEVQGEVILLNTLESMRTFDRKSAAWKSVRQLQLGTAGGACSKLNRFLLVCFADLKQYTFYYWVCVPAIKTQTLIPSTSSGGKALQDVGNVKAALLCKACHAFYHAGQGKTPFWIVEETGEGPSLTYECKEVGELETCANREKVFVAAIDVAFGEEAPGWPARNLLFMLAARFQLTSASLLCLREEKSGSFSPSRSVIHSVRLPALPPLSDMGALSADDYQVVGWEHNAKGGLGPRSVNLASTLDPKQRASAAMDLNLKLMRWRALPELQVDKVSQSRCLLLGAGTLGCAVARILQGWGCRKITFVDSGKVAFSNPVRQSLFEFSDCLEGGRPKAVAAAEALKRIFPHADSTGVQLTIPMPGHPVKEGSEMHKQSMEAVQALDKLVSDHDIVFLLTDTRESRWLPTVLSLAHNKFAVSVALGFDTFLVMRHGSASSPEGKRLGCYFCNDVAAPLNSTKNRTMDQQCTVVRPGLASIASALAVELVSAVLQHPMKSRAPAPTQNHGGNGNQKEEGEGEGDENGGRSILGDLPHSIRGFLDNFSQLCISCPAFPNCVACSDSVLQAYMDESRRQGFLLQVFNDPFFLEELTGLQELKNAIDDIDLDFDEEGENSDSDDFQLL